MRKRDTLYREIHWQISGAAAHDRSSQRELSWAVNVLRFDDRGGTPFRFEVRWRTRGWQSDLLPTCTLCAMCTLVLRHVNEKRALSHFRKWSFYDFFRNEISNFISISVTFRSWSDSKILYREVDYVNSGYDILYMYVLYRILGFYILLIQSRRNHFLHNRRLISSCDAKITGRSLRIKRNLATCANVRAMRVAARVGRLVRMRAHYYVLILYREGTNVRTYVKFLAPAA